MKQEIHQSRRLFLAKAGALTVALATPALFKAAAQTSTNLKGIKLNMEKWQLSDAEWQKRLTPEQYRVLREHGTERAGSSALNAEKRAGVYHCAGCDLSVYTSETKFESGTGWPSFYAPIEGHIGTSKDFKLVWPRTEVHCARCKGHLGHVFDDGPAPTGKRYCMNGVALVFKAA